MTEVNQRDTGIQNCWTGVGERVKNGEVKRPQQESQGLLQIPAKLIVALKRTLKSLYRAKIWLGSIRCSLTISVIYNVYVP